MSRITAIPHADPATALAHFSARLAVETDADDVGSALREGDVDFLLLDARSPEAYAAGHLPGARSLPHATIDADAVAQLPDLPLVVYCWGPGCNAAHKAGVRLARHGRAAKEMLGGYDAFLREGFPIAQGGQTSPSTSSTELPAGSRT